MPNDPVLMYYHLVPCMSQYFRLSCIFILWVDYISPHHFVTLRNFKQLYATFHFYVNIPAAFSLRVCFSLFSLLFLSFSRLPNTPLEDDNSRDAWLSLIALKRKVASLVWSNCRWSSCFKCYRYCIYGSQLFKLGFNTI